MNKILISGTGRSGTTFLILLFTLLELDTGYNKNNFSKFILNNCNSCMEKTISAPNRILKNPLFISNINDIVKKIKIDYMIIPLRDFEKSAKSRVSHQNKPGGLWGAINLNSQIAFYHKIVAEYLVSMVKYSIPTIFIDFEKMIMDSKYLYSKLEPVLFEHNISVEKFNEAYKLASKHQKKN